jgi:hypothetical protein
MRCHLSRRQAMLPASLSAGVSNVKGFATLQGIRPGAGRGNRNHCSSSYLSILYGETDDFDNVFNLLAQTPPKP